MSNFRLLIQTSLTHSLFLCLPRSLCLFWPGYTGKVHVSRDCMRPSQRFSFLFFFSLSLLLVLQSPCSGKGMYVNI